MKLLVKVKFIIAASAIGLILLWAFHQWGDRDSHVENKFLIRYFPFADKISTSEAQNTYLNKLQLKEVDFFGNRVNAIQFPINCQLDYYLKIPEDAELKVSFKHYGPQKIDDVEELKISIQEEDRPIELLLSYKFSNGFIKNKWRTEHVNLNRYSDKVVRLSFSIARYGKVSSHPEGLLLRPILLINSRFLQSQSGISSSVKLNISQEQSKKTNIIIIVLDAARPDHFSCYGYYRRTTPHMDNLAQEGVLFKNAFSVAPYTVASTTSLFTSLYPNTHRVTRWWDKIPERLKTLAEILGRNGYSSYGSGFVMRWGDWGKKGFKDTFDLYIETKEKLEDSLYIFLKDKFNTKKAKQPAFIYIHLRPPHADYDPPKEFDKWSDPEKRIKYADLIKVPALAEIDEGKRSINSEQLKFILDKYDGNLLWGDWLVHQILEGFKKFRLFENSLIILTSDHGEAFLEHGKILHNSTLYNEMIKIPLIIRFPSYIKPTKKVIKANVENIDFMPTVLEFLQINYSNLPIQGKSLLPLVFKNAQQVKPYLFSRAYYEEVFSIYDSQYKFIQMFDDSELYDLRIDPQEMANLALSRPILLGYYSSLARFYRGQLIRAQSEKPSRAKLDEEAIKKLRSLGYLQ